MANNRLPRSLRVCAWNAQSVAPKILSLKEFAKRYLVDIILISETFLTAAVDLRLPGYTTYRRDRTFMRGGGTAVLVRSSLDHHLCPSPALAGLETTAVMVPTAYGRLKIISVYKRPGARLQPNELDEVFEEDIPTLMAGDLNSKHPMWNSRVTNGAGRILLEHAHHRNLIVDGPVEPTYFGPRSRPDVLDIMVAKEPFFDHTITSLYELDSDHNPVLIELGEQQPDEEDRYKVTMSWPAFKDHLENSIGPITRINNTQDLEDQVRFLTDKIQQSVLFAENRSPKRIIHPDDIPPEIRELIRAKNRARRIYARTQYPDDRREMNRLNTEVRYALSDHRNRKWQENLEGIEEHAKLWKIKRALDRRQRSTVPPIHGPNGVKYTDQDKSEAFADHLETCFTPVYDNIDLDHLERIDRQTALLLNTPTELSITPASPDELKTIIAHLRSRKAPGHDNIRNGALKALPHKAIMMLTNIVNAALRLHHFPADWKSAKIIMIRKKREDPAFPQNYRPISLLSSLGKILEKVIHTRLQDQVDERNIIPDHQYGFRRHHSTIHQLHRLTDHITDGFNRKWSTVALSVDVAKAFDRVWHTGLLYKLHERGISPPLIKLIRSYLRNRTFSVSHLRCISQTRRIQAGVPQGSLLSPLLYNIYTSDMPPPPPNTNLAMFADDTLFYSQSRSPVLAARRVQAAADLYEDWYCKWRIAINPTKSTAIVFNKKSRRARIENLNMFGDDVPWANEIKYLGVTMDSRLTWSQHVDSLVGIATGTLIALYPLLAGHSKLNLHLKTVLYKAAIRPRLTYAAQVWGHAAAAHIGRLQVQQNKFLRIMVGAPWFVRNTTIHRDLQIPLILDHIKELATRFFENIPLHENPLISDINVQPRPGVHKRPQSILTRQ